MKEKTFFAGFGGQGIISLGQIWCYCGMKEGKEVSFIPFYGAEKRGGIARANCIISDSPITSPVISRANSVVVMNQDSLNEGLSLLSEGGLLLVNDSLVDIKNNGALKDRFRVVSISATNIAETLGNTKIANMVMLGALARETGALSLKTVEEILESFFPPNKQFLVPLNVQAIQEGMNKTHA